jgi:hypothetical protein
MVVGKEKTKGGKSKNSKEEKGQDENVDFFCQYIIKNMSYLSQSSQSIDYFLFLFFFVCFLIIVRSY